MRFRLVIERVEEISEKAHTAFFLVGAVRTIGTGVAASAVIQASAIPALELVFGTDCRSSGQNTKEPQ